jgi:hypothetical protein
VGYLNRANVMGSWRGHLHEESVREHGWLQNLRTHGSHLGTAGVLTGRVVAINGNEILVAVDSRDGEPAEVFGLTAPVRGILMGDEVRVDYRTDEEGHKIALRVVEVSSRQ